MTIWKWELKTTDEQTILMPLGARLLTVQVQNGVPCIWALVNPTANQIERRFGVYGTGNPVPDEVGEYVATYQLADGRLVFHVFDRGPA